MSGLILTVIVLKELALVKWGGTAMPAEKGFSST